MCEKPDHRSPAYHIFEIVCIARVEHETVVEMKSRNIRADCDLGNIHTGIHQRSDLRAYVTVRERVSV